MWVGTFYVCFAAHLGSTGGFLLLHYSSSVVDNPGISKCLNTMFLSSPYLYFIIGFNCDLFVARNYSWISQKTSTRTKQIYAFITMEAEGEGRDPKLACPPLPPYRPYPPPPHTHSLSPPSPLSPPPNSNSLLAVPKRYFHCGTFCLLLCSVSLSNVFFFR